MGIHWQRPRVLGGLALCFAMVALSAPVPATTAATCPNEVFRTGPSAQLSDCRAYEMVSPADSNGRIFNDLSPWRFAYDMFGVEPVSPSGDSLVFETYGGPFEAPAGGNGRVEGDAWEARRGEAGWAVVRHVTPTGSEAPMPDLGGVSADHGYSFAFAQRYPPRTGFDGSLALEGEADYLGDPSGHFELTGIGSLGSERLAQGRYISPGGEHVIFSTGRSVQASGWCNDYEEIFPFKCPVAKLEPNAPPARTGAIYDREADGPTHVVSLLPENVTPAAGQEAFYQGASADGSSVAFEIGTTLYIRVDNGEAGEKTEEVASGPTTFGGISADGRYLYYLSGVSDAVKFTGDIHRFDTTTDEDESVTSSTDAQMVNVSADGTHLYFISPSQLDGSEGVAGEPNLYIWSGGASPNFVTTVDPADIDGEGPSLTNWASHSVAPKNGSASGGPGRDPSRTTPDGTVIAFESRAQLTPYDNNGHTEIYRYDTGDEGFTCVSCNPLQEPATADARLEKLTNEVLQSSTVIHNLSVDGSRIFFETSEALVDADQGTVNDVYEWQQSVGGGEVALISSGDATEYDNAAIPGYAAPEPNLLLGISPDGEDVFFSSQEPLLPGAPVGGAPMIYDARVSGGFPTPPPSLPPCGDLGACRPPVSAPPTLGGAASADLRGAGNVVPKKKAKKHRRQRCHKRRRCAKGRAQSSANVGPAVVDAGTQSVDAQSVDARGRLGSAADARAPLPRASQFDYWELESVDAGLSTTQAAGHPDFTTALSVTPAKEDFGSPRPEDLEFELPPGLYGNPNLVPKCRTGDFLGGECPIDSQVGVSRILLFNHAGQYGTVPLFNLAPVHPEDEIARLGVVVANFPTYIDVSVDTAGDYGITAAVHGVNSAEVLEGAKTIVWGDPADHSHDKERLTIQEGTNCSSPNPGDCIPGGERETEDLEPIAFFTNPSSCGPLQVGFQVTSYQLPGKVFSKTAQVEPGPIDQCQGLPFAPTFEAHPTSRRAGAPTGLEAVMKLPQSADPEVPSTATMREAKVVLPAGMGISSSAADGQEACSAEQVHFHEELDAQCPDASKLGTAEISSPALPEPLQGAVYLRSPEPGRLFRFWLVTDALGLHVKLPAEIEADPTTGLLTTTLSDLPPVPVDEVVLDFFGGDRAPLMNPEACGTYQTSFSFQPHSEDPPATGQTQMTIDEGCGAKGFNPQLHAGSINPTAGAFTPFMLDLAREDSEEDLGSFEVTLPPGLLAKLKGVPLCPEAQAPSGQCPAASRLGTLIAAAGPGPNPFWIPQAGKAQPAIYLAGPYKGAPYSIVAVVPAQAGPFDLGNVVSRSALAIDLETALATVKTDPLPQFVAGVPVTYRRLHALVDRPEFTLNPTDCSELAITSAIASVAGVVAHPSERFQVDGCRALGFKPKLSLEFAGQMGRSGNPAVRSVLRARPGDANIASAVVTLPRTEFIDNAHISNPCTRVQFAAGKCPPGSVLGTARANTPLLDKPLKGPVYFRSNGGDRELPDVVADLKGQVHIVLVGFIDSKGGRVRTRFLEVPDAPVTRFSLNLFGGKRGLLENTRNLCKGRHLPRVSLELTAQNGRRLDRRPVLKGRCGVK